jgi:hypothetical protein
MQNVGLLIANSHSHRRVMITCDVDVVCTGLV